MDINEQKTAILLIEFQNQWTQKGLYHRLIKGQLEKRGVLENTKNLVSKARERGMKIIHAPLVIDPKNKKGGSPSSHSEKCLPKGRGKRKFPTVFLRKEICL